MWVTYHVGVDKRSEIEIWLSIEIKFVMDQLIRGIGVNSLVWKIILWNIFCTSISWRVWWGQRVFDRVLQTCGTTLSGDWNDLVRVDVLIVSLSIELEYTLWRTIFEQVSRLWNFFFLFSNGESRSLGRVFLGFGCGGWVYICTEWRPAWRIIG